MARAQEEGKVESADLQISEDNIIDAAALGEHFDEILEVLKKNIGAIHIRDFVGIDNAPRMAGTLVSAKAVADYPDTSFKLKQVSPTEIQNPRMRTVVLIDIANGRSAVFLDENRVPYLGILSAKDFSGVAKKYPLLSVPDLLPNVKKTGYVPLPKTVVPGDIDLEALLSRPARKPLVPAGYKLAPTPAPAVPAEEQPPATEMKSELPQGNKVVVEEPEIKPVERREFVTSEMVSFSDQNLSSTWPQIITEVKDKSGAVKVTSDTGEVQGYFVNPAAQNILNLSDQGMGVDDFKSDGVGLAVPQPAAVWNRKRSSIVMLFVPVSVFDNNAELQAFLVSRYAAAVQPVAVKKPATPAHPAASAAEDSSDKSQGIMQDSDRPAETDEPEVEQKSLIPDLFISEEPITISQARIIKTNILHQIGGARRVVPVMKRNELLGYFLPKDLARSVSSLLERPLRSLSMSEFKKNLTDIHIKNELSVYLISNERALGNAAGFVSAPFFDRHIRPQLDANAQAVLKKLEQSKSAPPARRQSKGSASRQAAFAKVAASKIVTPFEVVKEHGTSVINQKFNNQRLRDEVSEVGDGAIAVKKSKVPVGYFVSMQTAKSEIERLKVPSENIKFSDIRTKCTEFGGHANVYIIEEGQNAPYAAYIPARLYREGMSTAADFDFCSPEKIDEATSSVSAAIELLKRAKAAGLFRLNGHELVLAHGEDHVEVVAEHTNGEAIDNVIALNGVARQESLKDVLRQCAENGGVVHFQDGEGQKFALIRERQASGLRVQPLPSVS